MGTHIRIKRGKKNDLPKSAPSGMPLWCEDTKELYIGTGNGTQIIHTFDADTVDGFHASSFLQNANQFVINCGATTGKTTYVYKQSGYFTRKYFMEWRYTNQRIGGNLQAIGTCNCRCQ